MKKMLNQAGDTIVEVLIAIAVISLVLGSSYAITRRSSVAIRVAQEHSEALKIAESQLEQLKSLSGNTAGNNDVFTRTAPATPTPGSGFCMYIDSGTSKIVTLSDTADECTITNGIDYHITTSRTNPVSNTFTFTVKVYWDSLSRTGQQDNVSLNYNLDQL